MSDKKMTKIAACPFCGPQSGQQHKPEVCSIQCNWFAVVCPLCGAQGPMLPIWADGKQGAIDKWNAWTLQLDDLKAENEKLKGQCVQLGVLRYGAEAQRDEAVETLKETELILYDWFLAAPMDKLPGISQVQRHIEAIRSKHPEATR